MPAFEYPFTFTEDAIHQTEGSLKLENPLPYPNEGSGFYRPGRLFLKDNGSLEIMLYHNPATSKFIYLRQGPPDRHLFEVVGLDPHLADGFAQITLPGQLCLGAERTKLIGEAINWIFRSPTFVPIFNNYTQENLAVFPIAREGLKYQVADAIFDNHGFYCDEIVLDAHHVFDSSVPVYNRTVELTLFKDKDLDHTQKEHISVAYLADSIASGLVMKEVILRGSERFENLEQIEVISPLTTIRGLCRIAQSEAMIHKPVRIHIFETPLNALPPDFYYSAHFHDPRFHICPELEQQYRDWWGKDKDGNAIADTACAGYGWSEVFYSPRKQIQMMNTQLTGRHGLSVADIVTRNLHD